MILTTQSSKDYALLDSGEGEKLERYGEVIVRRPDPQALWRQRLSEEEWKRADAVFESNATRASWTFRRELPSRWGIEFGGLHFWIRPSSFKHVGLFPEQEANWNWMRLIINEQLMMNKKTANVLNLFGYTGGASLAAAQAGASVVHVDGSKVAIGWARDNAALSNLSEKPIRWILDDAVKFVTREVKRGHRYDGIILDPPAFGHGPNKELWKIEDHLLPLLDLCRQVLSDQPLFFLINGYASGYSPIAYANNLEPLVKQYGGVIEMGELTIEESGGDGRLLPCGIFARWQS